MTQFRNLLPGIGILLAVGLTARALVSIAPLGNYLIVTIVIGLIVGNGFRIPEWGRRGVETYKLWLKVGIVLMGAAVALDSVVAAGPMIFAFVVGTVIATILLVEVLARGLFAIQEETGSLLAAGSSICGVSAVVAIAGSIEADERSIAYAAATVLLFDAVTMLVYPLIGHTLGLSDTVFGIWAGLTMFSTGPVIAAGFAFSDAAGEWALLIKLTRNALIGFVAIGYALCYTSQSDGRTERGVPETVSYFWETFPKFVIGFLAVMIIANAGVVNENQIRSLEHASNWAFMLAFAGLGLDLRLDELRSTGIQPILVVLVGLSIVSSIILLLLRVFV